MKEYCSERVSPENESDVVMHFEAFGWELENAQEFYHQSEKLLGANTSFSEYRGFQTSFASETQVTNYVTLRFSRDMQMSNYARLKALQDKFERMEEPKQTKCPVRIHNKPISLTVFSCIAVFAIITLIFFAVKINNIFFSFILIAAAILLAVLPIVTVIRWVKYKIYYCSDLKKILAHQRQYDLMVESYEKERDAILTEAVKLSSAARQFSVKRYKDGAISKG